MVRTPEEDSPRTASSTSGDREFVAGASQAPARRNRIAPLAIAFCSLWSSAFIAGKFGLRSSPPLLFLSVRFVLAAAGTVIAARALGERFPRGGREWCALAALGLLNNTLYLGLSFYGLQTVSAGLATVIVSANPLVTALLAYLVLGEDMGPRKLLGLGLGLAGVTFIMRHRIQAGSDDSAGIVMICLGTAAMAAATILFKRARLHSGPLAVNGLQLVFGAAGLLPIALCLEDVQRVRPDAQFLLAQAYLVLAISGLAMILWFRILRRTSAGNASALHFLNPAIGMLFGWLVLDEPVWPSDFIGIIPVALGIALVTRPGRRRARAPDP